MKRTVRTYLVYGLLALGLQASFSLAAQGDAPVPPLPPTKAGAMPPADRAQVQRRLESVSVLIEKSTVAQQIAASGNPEAIAQREKARGLYAQAESAYRNGDYETAQKLLFDVTRAMVAGARLTVPTEVSEQKKRADFDRRMESVKILLSAQRRISEEKKLGAKGREAGDKAEALMGEALALKEANRIDEGRAVLARAYETTRAAIAGMRGGETLVRPLQFASKQDEYAYEIDRNDTHRMLVDLLLKEKRGTDPALDSRALIYLERAAALRARAEEHAAKGDYVSGIERLEESTRELVSAIRGAGVYIP